MAIGESDHLRAWAISRSALRLCEASWQPLRPRRTDHPSQTLASTNPRVSKSGQRDDDCVNQPRAFSCVGERSGGKGRKRTHRVDADPSPRHGAENGTVRKCLALLGMLREAGTDARWVLPSTTGDWFFGRKRIGSSGKIRICNPPVNRFMRNEELSRRRDDTPTLTGDSRSCGNEPSTCAPRAMRRPENCELNRCSGPARRKFRPICQFRILVRSSERPDGLIIIDHNFDLAKPDGARKLFYLRELWSHPPGLNRRPADYESAALPAELGWPAPQ